MEKIKKIVELFGLEIVAGVLFLLAVVFCFDAGDFLSAAVAAVVVLGLVALSVMRYRKQTPAPIHPALIIPTPAPNIPSRARAKRPAGKKGRK